MDASSKEEKDRLLTKLTAAGEASGLEGLLQRSVLDIEEYDTNLYCGTELWRPIFARGVYGGQVIGQALVAASKTKPSEMHCHSIHCVFIQPGQTERPILYSVERLRDGKSFCTRSVKALQGGQAMFTMLSSYHKQEESPFSHQFTMPECPPPEDLLTTTELLRWTLENKTLTDQLKKRINTALTDQVPIEVKPVDPEIHYFPDPVSRQPKCLYWIRAVGHIGDDQNLHRCVAAYFSDMHLLHCVTMPFQDFQMKMVASLDHAMWFHTTFRADEWMLMECESPYAGGNRGLALGRLWRRDGVLAVSVAQEGVVRGRQLQDKSKL